MVFEPFNRLKPCRHGTMLYNIHDAYIGRSLDLYGEFSEGEVALFAQLLKPGMAVVEVGANVGAHTVFLAQKVGPEGGVLAFEPQRIVFQTLCANLALNSLTNVDCRQAAVGKEAGALIVPPLDYRQKGNYGGVMLMAHGPGERVPVVALDEFDLPRCDLVKVDVEGMEKDVLEGARETLVRHQPLLYVENDRDDRSADLIRLLDALGYEMYWHWPPLFNPRNFAGNAENVFGDIVSVNMLCWPRGVGGVPGGLWKVDMPEG